MQTIYVELQQREDELRDLAHFILDYEETIILLPHLRADGDAYGSSFALARALQELGKRVICFLEEERASDFFYLGLQDLEQVYPELNPQEQEELLKSTYLPIMLDASEPNRLGSREEIFTKAPCRVILDHHLSSAQPERFYFIKPECAAASELVFSLIGALEKQSGQTLFSLELATALYTGILTDTSNFSYESVTPQTLAVAAILRTYEVPIAQIVDHLFRELSYEQFKLEAKLRDLTQVSPGGEISYLTIPYELLAETSLDDQAIEHMPALLRDIKGVKVSVMLRANEKGGIRGNLRSVPELNIQPIAKALGGGGHKNAAGFTLLAGDLAEALAEVLALLNDTLGVR